MNNISNIDLEYNFNNLRNMIQFNCAKLYQESSKSYLNEDESVVVDGIKGGDKNWCVHMIENSLENILEVGISDAELSFAIATPHEPSKLPFITDYLEYKRYETVNKDTVAVADIRNFPTKTYEITSDIYSLQQIPNAIYIWWDPVHRHCMALIRGVRSLVTLIHKLHTLRWIMGTSQSLCTTILRGTSIS